MLSNSQIQQLEKIEQALLELIASKEYTQLVEGDYHPDLTIGDACQAVSYLLDYHLVLEPVAISPNFQKLFSDRKPSKKLTSIDFDEFESLNNF
jgi:hypothetical protein